MDLKIFLILSLTLAFSQSRSARMTKDWPPVGNLEKRQNMNPHNRMALKDVVEFNRMAQHKRDMNPHNRMALKEVSSYNKMGKRSVECASSPPDSHEHISTEVRIK